LKIVAVSYASIGYGSGQIPEMINYLGSLLHAECTIIEPDQLERPPLSKAFEKIEVKRLLGVFHPFSPEGKIEFILQSTKLINELEPDILVVCTSYTLPILFKIKKRPKKVIYYSLENIPETSEEIELNRNIGGMVDLIVFPEENRASRFLDLTGLRNEFCIVYNCTNSIKNTQIKPPAKRNGKIIYHGGIHEETGAEYFLQNKLQRYPIDLYGLIEAPTVEKKEKLISTFRALSQNVRYHGYLPGNDLEIIRKDYLFSIVIWLPTSLNNIYACPNKFFESIASGIPPISTPHPQTNLICKRYNCGIIMEDANFGSFLKTIRHAMQIEPEEYSEMVKNCQEAVKYELNWEFQMQKIVNRLNLSK